MAALAVPPAPTSSTRGSPPRASRLMLSRSCTRRWIATQSVLSPMRMRDPSPALLTVMVLTAPILRAESVRMCMCGSSSSLSGIVTDPPPKPGAAMVSSATDTSVPARRERRVVHGGGGALGDGRAEEEEGAGSRDQPQLHLEPPDVIRHQLARSCRAGKERMGAEGEEAVEDAGELSFLPHAEPDGWQGAASAEAIHRMLHIRHLRRLHRADRNLDHVGSSLHAEAEEELLELLGGVGALGEVVVGAHDPAAALSLRHLLHHRSRPAALHVHKLAPEAQPEQEKRPHLLF
eukprot:750539-Hanusia_phi.AAC.2